MTFRLTRQCGPSDGQPAECSADFTIDGQSGHQKLHPGGTVTLAAVEPDTQATYRWEVTTSPPNCHNLLTRIAPHTATLSLPSPGAYVVQLTVTKGDCLGQSRTILWAVTPRLLYCIPATGEPLRFDGRPEWAGDLARLMLEVDHNLPTDAQKTALDRAKQPGETNPFATMDDLSKLPGQPGQPLSDDEIEAIKAADNPNKCNPFITQSALPPAELTKDQKEAIAAAADPNRCNPFITQSALPGPELSDNQKAALRERPEHPPGYDNPFVTLAELPDPELSDNQKAALRERPEHPPGYDNPFVTLLELPGPELSDNQKAALYEGRSQPPAIDNPFVTLAELPGPELTDHQRAALREAREYPPSADNPFVTQAELSGPLLTDHQQAALREERENPPTFDNPFVTLADLPGPELTNPQQAALDAAKEPGQTNPFVTLNELREGAPFTVDEIAAIKQAGEPISEHKPSGDNPFATRKELPGPELASAQKAALDAAYDPSDANPFITKNALPVPELTSNQKSALDAANNPSALNPFITLSNLPGLELTSDQKAAVYAAKNPSAANPFITLSALPSSELTAEQKAALDAASSPNAANPLATMADLNQLRPRVRVVAAGQIDLSQEAGTEGWGGLKVVDSRAGKGLATLSFNGYQPDQSYRYIIKALPINDKARRQEFDEFTVVQFVDFGNQGFTLQMIQPLVHGGGRAALGPCMIEVSEILPD